MKDYSVEKISKQDAALKAGFKKEWSVYEDSSFHVKSGTFLGNDVP